MAASDMKLAFVIFLHLLLHLSSCSSSSYPQTLQIQASILVSLKNGFQAPDPPLHGWSTSNHESLCSWYGVQCNHNNSSIISLDISNLNLSGFLSPVITQLHSLRNLSVSGNNFSGTFPSQIDNLSGLRLLNISNNQFNGTLLDWKFSLMKELLVLDAYDNNLQGPLPLGLTQLESIEYLDLGGNYFDGKIPSEYGNMKHLTYLSLAGNDLNGFLPKELGNLTNLKQLRLGYSNEFDGGIPPELGNLINLVRLDLSTCGLEGPIPPELGNLNQLDTLFLYKNQLTGSVPSQLGNLTRLMSLDLSLNGLSGEIPLEFSGLRELTVLNLFRNKLHGQVPPLVAELPNLQVLQLWQNNFTGSIPAKLGQNGKLILIDLSTNKLTGKIPKSLCFGRKLQTLILLDNFLFGPLPDDLGHCDTLLKLRLQRNYLSGSLPSGLLYLPQLSQVELQNNYLTGRLPEKAGLGDKGYDASSSRLSFLDLSSNKLSGPLPVSVQNLSALQTVSMSGNHLTGNIPTGIGKLQNVVKLDMSRNSLSGTIPPEIGNCQKLTYLDLSQNQLSGPIPTQIAEVSVLSYLNISWNNLSRGLPEELGSTKSLAVADFSHNNLSGLIPEKGQYSLFNYTSFEGNPFLCGSSLGPCNTTSSGDIHRSSKSRLKLGLALGLLALSLVFVVLAFLKTRKSKKNAKTWKLTGFQNLSFTSKDISECIKDSNIIGKGGAGIVYHGTMPNGEHVAVKKLLGGSSKDSSHDHGLSAEIQTLGKIRHRNIVRLLAFCSNKETNLLVYEFMPNGSLGQVLHGKNGGRLDWDTRLKIAIEAAKGLCYLHHDCNPLIVHRDVKSNNILLDSEFEAHVADFGLAKFLYGSGASSSECMSAITGSYGYIAPEYAYTLKVDEKSDVYSYGVVLLELLTGRKPVGDFGEEGMDIVQWTKIQTNSNKDKVSVIIDQRLKDTPTEEEAAQVFFVAMCCVQERSVERPTMREVVQMLAQARQPNTFLMQ